MEVWHFATDSLILKSQMELLTAASQAQVHTTGWPTGVVPDRTDESRPQSTSEGIFARIAIGHPWKPGRIYAYWSLNKSGDFYSLMSLWEDDSDEVRSQKVIWSDSRIIRAADALIHCSNLYKVLGVEPNTRIEMTVRYAGLRGRKLTDSSLYIGVNLNEDAVTVSPITFRLGAVETEIVDLVKKLCEPLFVIFDFASVSDDVYRRIVTDFVRGKTR